MAKREGVEIDGLFLRGLAAPLDYVQPGWERELGEGKKAKPGKKIFSQTKSRDARGDAGIAFGFGSASDDGAFDSRARRGIGLGR